MSTPDRPEASKRHDLRSFGRRRGRKRSARQDQILKDGLQRWGLDLEAAPPQPLTTLFAQPGLQADQAIDEVWLEIGFGGAEHMLSQAKRHAKVGLIGAEPFEDGVVKALTAVGEDGLTNVRIYPNDVRPLLRWLPDASISRAFILFPDPWPKARHATRRLVSESLLDHLARVMVPGAELRIATDIATYAGSVLEAISRQGAFDWQAKRPSDWRNRPSDWPQTRYEAKARAVERKPYFLRFIRHKT